MVRIPPRVQRSAASTAITAARRLKTSDSHITGAESGTCSGSFYFLLYVFIVVTAADPCRHLYVQMMKHFSTGEDGQVHLCISSKWIYFFLVVVKV